MHPRVKRTYSSRPRQYPFSPRTSSPPGSPDGKRKRILLDCVNITTPPLKRVKIVKSFKSTNNIVAVASSSSPAKRSLVKPKPLTQLHFVVDSTLRTCPSCSLTYTRGAINDEALHRKHCARVRRGLEWGKEEEKEVYKAGVRVIEDIVRLKGGTHGRIISVPANVGGKIGSKLTNLLKTINIAISSPELLPETLVCSKAYIFLVPSPSGTRERIAGCLIAQRITTAMNVVPDSHNDADNREKLVKVDGGLYCSPRLFPTPLGIPRLFVSSTHRRQGIAKHLLMAAAKTFVHGCELDPTKGEVAFSQPTGDGRKVMENWGNGHVRIYQE